MCIVVDVTIVSIAAITMERASPDLIQYVGDVVFTFRR